MQNSLGLAHFFQNADGVAYAILAIMAVMSVGTWYIIITKAIQLFSGQQKSDAFLKDFWAAPSLDDVDRLIQKEGAQEPFSRLVAQGISAKHLHNQSDHKRLSEAGAEEDFLTRTLRRAIEEDNLQLESGLSFVATVASSAPFIGLFGTVWGIYNALMAIGLSGQGTLDKVAGPVGEALIMTGIGLVVAIPAAIAYNFFARHNRSVVGRLESFGHDVFTLLSRGVKLAPQRVTGSK